MNIAIHPATTTLIPLFFYQRKMLKTTCILVISVLSSFSPLTTALLNLSLPGQHPNPDAVVQEFHRYGKKNKFGNFLRGRRIINVSFYYHCRM